MSINVLFMAYFFMRFIAANDKLVFMFQLNSLIDFFTVPPSFVTLILGRAWIGLRYINIDFPSSSLNTGNKRRVLAKEILQ